MRRCTSKFSSRGASDLSRQQTAELPAAFPAPHFAAPLTPCNLPVERCTVPREQASKRILIFRAGALGDILMGTPLVAALRAAYPTAHITWGAEYTQSQAIDANPHIDELLIWNSLYWKRMLRRLNYPLWLYRALRFRAKLQARRYDIFISLQPEEWPLLTRNCSSATRIGVFDTFARFYGTPYSGPNARYFNHTFNGPQRADHRTEQFLLPLEGLNLPAPKTKQMRLGYTSDDRAAANRFLAGQGIGAETPFLILTPQTTWTTKTWPAERFVALGDRLIKQGFRVLLTGSAAEREAVERIAAHMATPPAVAAGNLSFRELAAIIGRASLLVSGDTGPMHAAAALETPFVALFGSTSPCWYAPLAGRGISLSYPVPCGPCDRKKCVNVGDEYEKCMGLVTVDEVFEALLRTLDKQEHKRKAVPA